MLAAACGRFGYDLVNDVDPGGPGGNDGGTGLSTSSGGNSAGTTPSSGGSSSIDGGSSSIDGGSSSADGGSSSADGGTTAPGGAGDTSSGGVVNGGAGDGSGGACGSSEICDGQDNDCSGTPDDGGVCLSNCFGYTYGGHAYVFCNDGVVLADAIAGCAAHDMVLVKIDDQPENEWLRSIVYSYTGDDFAAYQWRWIGLTDPEHDGVWLWPDGSPVTYENWGGGNPGNNDDGVTLQNSSGLWNSMPEDLTRPYICELY